MKLRLEYEKPRHRTGGRDVWDYALFGVCLAVGVLMAAMLLGAIAGVIR